MAFASELTSPRVLSAEEFAEGLIASLAASNQRQITAGQLQLHRAFRKVLLAIKSRHNDEVDLRAVDYDPLYGLSGWLDEFLARAQRDLLISFPNPSYGRIEILLTQKEGQDLLAQYGHRETLKELSGLFEEELKAA